MDGAWGYSNEEEPNEGSGKGLRKFAEDMAAQNKALMDRLAKLEEQQTKTTVADLIESQGVARSAAQYYQGDADPEKVTAWVTDLRGAFGAPIPTNEVTVEPVLDATNQEQYQRLMQAGSGGTPVGGNIDSLGAALNGAKNSAEMIAAFQTYGR